MIAVQAVNGKFYLDPVFWDKTWAITFAEGPTLQYKGHLISWKTARKVLVPAGFKARWADGPFGDCIVLDQKLVDATRYRIRLLGPIPVPEWFDAVLEQRPAGGDFEILSW